MWWLVGFLYITGALLMWAALVMAFDNEPKAPLNTWRGYVMIGFWFLTIWGAAAVSAREEWRKHKLRRTFEKAGGKYRE